MRAVTTRPRSSALSEKIQVDSLFETLQSLLLELIAITHQSTVTTDRDQPEEAIQKQFLEKISALIETLKAILHCEEVGGDVLLENFVFLLESTIQNDTKLLEFLNEALSNPPSFLEEGEAGYYLQIIRTAFERIAHKIQLGLMLADDHTKDSIDPKTMGRIKELFEIIEPSDEEEYSAQLAGFIKNDEEYMEVVSPLLLQILKQIEPLESLSNEKKELIRLLMKFSTPKDGGIADAFILFIELVNPILKIIRKTAGELSEPEVLQILRIVSLLKKIQAGDPIDKAPHSHHQESDSFDEKFRPLLVELKSMQPNDEFQELLRKYILFSEEDLNNIRDQCYWYFQNKIAYVDDKSDHFKQLLKLMRYMDDPLLNEATKLKAKEEAGNLAIFLLLTEGGLVKPKSKVQNTPSKMSFFNNVFIPTFSQVFENSIKIGRMVSEAALYEKWLNLKEGTLSLDEIRDFHAKLISLQHLLNKLPKIDPTRPQHYSKLLELERDALGQIISEVQMKLGLRPSKRSPGP